MELTGKHRDSFVAAGLALARLLAFYFSIRPTQQHFDYSVRMASALLEGHVGVQTKPPSWLNEMVPEKGRYYSVFPLGAVLSMVPVAVLQKIHLLKNYPGGALAALIAALCVWLFYR